MEILTTKQKIIIGVISVAIIIFIGYYIVTKFNKEDTISFENISTADIEKTDNIQNEQEKEIKNTIIVHITGEVKKEGIIEIEDGARVADVIKKAGGATEEADLSKINLAYMVKDEQKIYVPSKLDKEDIEYVTEGIDGTKKEEINTKSSKININKANQTELETLNGIGPSTALKIINYRESKGNFNSIEEIKNVPGIGEAKFDNIKDNICVK